MEGFFHSLEVTDLWNSFLVSYLPDYKYAVDKALPESYEPDAGCAFK